MSNVLTRSSGVEIEIAIEKDRKQSKEKDNKEARQRKRE